MFNLPLTVISSFSAKPALGFDFGLFCVNVAGLCEE